MAIKESYAGKINRKLTKKLRVIAVAAGREKADLVLKNATYVNVFSNELCHGDIAVAAVEKEIDRVTAAKAADELLTLSGIHASFVLFKNGTGVNLSARSLGEINVQFIMEKLGGGGNSTTAGGQVADASVDEVRARLLNAIDEYMEE